MIIPVEISLDVQEISPLQRAVAWVLALLLLAAVVVALWRSRYGGLPLPNRQRKSQFAAAKAATSFHLARFESDAALQNGEPTLRGLFRGEEPDRPTTRAALAQARSELAGRVLPYYAALPRPVRRLLGLAVSILVLAPIAASTAAVIALIQSDGGLPSLGWIVTSAVTATQQAATAIVSLLATFPYVDVVASLALAYGLLIAEWLFEYWGVWVVLLGGLAAVIWSLETRLDDLPPAREGPRGSGLIAAAVVAVGVWLVGVLGVVIGRTLGVPDLGALAGGVLAAALGLGAFAYGSYRFVTGLRTLARAHRERSGPVLAYLLARRIGAGLAVFAVPFVLAYAVAAALALPRVVDAWLATSLTVQAGTVMIVVLAGLALALAVRESWPDIRAALAETAADQQLRLVLGWYGFPALGVVLGYILAYSVLRSIVLAGGLALFVGLATPRVQRLFHRFKYAPDLGREATTPANRVTVEAARLSVAGQTDYYARLNGGTELLAPTEDGLIAAIQHVGAELFASGEAPATIAEVYHDAAADVGLEDYEAAARKAVEASRKDLFGALREADGVLPVEELEPELEEWPEGAWRLRLAAAIERGTIERYREHGEEIVALRRDPFAV